MKRKNMFLLDGLLFCYECKHKIGVRGKKRMVIIIWYVTIIAEIQN